MHQWGRESLVGKKYHNSDLDKRLNECFQNSFCGPFLISKGFWIDAGQCVLENDNPSDSEGK